MKSNNLRIALGSLGLMVLLGTLILGPLGWTLLFGTLLGGLITYLVIVRKGSIEHAVPKEALKESQKQPSLVPTPMHSSFKYRDVAGLEDAKHALDQITRFLHDPSPYKALDARIPKGVILYGPPGVGKTLLAKAVAGEAGVPFFYQSAATFVEIYVGMGAKRIRELFSAAKQKRPAIVFIDEIDAIGKQRSGERSDEREATLNQLLTEMDGFEESEGIVVIAATNRIEMLDSALLRPGRFDRRILLELPDIKGREAILKNHLHSRTHTLEIPELASLTAGFSPAAIANLINEAALHAVDAQRSVITPHDIEAVRHRVEFGIRQSTILDAKERNALAHIQAAKAFVAKNLCVPFTKITLSTPEFTAPLAPFFTQSELKARITVYRMGRISALHFFNERFGIEAEENRIIRHFLKCYQETFGEEEVETLLTECDTKAHQLISAHGNTIKQLAEHFNTNEVLRYDDLV